jgi:hypothetical protein
VKHGQDAVIFSLVNESSDEVAQANAIAKEINAVANFNFQNSKLLAVAKSDAGKLDGLWRIGNGHGHSLRRCENIRARKNFAQNLDPTLPVIFLAQNGLNFVACHGLSKDSERIMSGIVSRAWGAEVTGLSSDCCNG